MIDVRKLLLGAIGFAAVGLATAVIFLGHPEIDLAIASAFAEGINGFPLRQHPAATFFNDLINIVAVLTALACLVGWILAARMRMAIAGLWTRHYAFLISSLIVGPGLIANALFKENWGRARPRQVTEFGGTAEFSPPLLLSDQCSSNCSFVSGDASMAFFFLAVAFVMPPKRRARAVAVALVFGLFIGFIRVIQGAHFFSDVIFAGVFVGLAVLLLYRLILSPWSPPQGIQPPPLSRQLGLAGAGHAQRPEGKSRLWLFFRAMPKDLGVDETPN